MKVQDRIRKEIPENRWMWDDATGAVLPVLDEAVWKQFKDLTKDRRLLKIQLSRELSLGIRFPGYELGLNKFGAPFLWQVAVFNQGQMEFSGKFPSVEEMDKHMLSRTGQLRKVLREHFNLGIWRRAQVLNTYLAWRLRGGLTWKQLFALLWKTS